MPTTTTFECDCCVCLEVRQLRDCCTNELVPLSVCAGVDRYTTVYYDGKCYENSEEITSRATAIASGWSILNNDDFQVYDGECEDDVCYEFYQIFIALCGADEVDTDYPIQSLVGPLTERPPEPYTNVYAQINGRWFIQDGILQLKKDCETIEDILGEAEYEIISATLAATQEEKPNMCCHKCYESGEWPDTSSTFWEKPCCLQVSGFAFSGCGTFPGPEPDWDGKLFSNWLEPADAYAQAQSYGTEPCYGNWDTCNGRIPGTDVSLAAGTILWWSCDDDCWYLQLGFTWVGSGGSDPEDPTGTYTAIGTPSCGGPATLTVTAI